MNPEEGNPSTPKHTFSTSIIALRNVTLTLALSPTLTTTDDGSMVKVSSDCKTRAERATGSAATISMIVIAASRSVHVPGNFTHKSFDEVVSSQPPPDAI